MALLRPKPLGRENKIPTQHRGAARPVSQQKLPPLALLVTFPSLA